MFKQYQSVILIEDVNSVIGKGMVGVILEIWDEDTYEVEFVKDDATNHVFNGKPTFTLKSNILRVKD